MRWPSLLVLLCFAACSEAQGAAPAGASGGRLVSGSTLSQDLNANSKKITGLATATASSDALSYPWITATTGEASLSGSSYTFTTNNFEDIGLSVSLPSTGTYLIQADVRANVSCSMGTGFITFEFYNATSAAAVTSSERTGPLCSTVGLNFTNTTPMHAIVAVSGTPTIKVYGKTPSGYTYTGRQVLSDSDGLSRLSYVKLSP